MFLEGRANMAWLQFYYFMHLNEKQMPLEELERSDAKKHNSVSLLEAPYFSIIVECFCVHQIFSK